MILWIHGNSGSGKTYLAKEIQKEYGGILLDGDAMRTCWTLGFNENNRYENNLRIAKIAKVLHNQGFDIIISTICPYKALRLMIQEIIPVEFIELLGGKEPTQEYPYEADNEHTSN